MLGTITVVNVDDRGGGVYVGVASMDDDSISIGVEVEVGDEGGRDKEGLAVSGGAFVVLDAGVADSADDAGPSCDEHVVDDDGVGTI